MSALRPIPSFREQPISRLIFMSRWLQLPLYLGLIVAQGVYVYYFWVELIHLVEAAFGHQEAIDAILKNVTPPGGLVPPPETVVMLVVLGLIDVVMISNLLIMVIVGGYETFALPLTDSMYPASATRWNAFRMSFAEFKSLASTSDFSSALVTE